MRRRDYNLFLQTVTPAFSGLNRRKRHSGAKMNTHTGVRLVFILTRIKSSTSPPQQVIMLIFQSYMTSPRYPLTTVMSTFELVFARCIFPSSQPAHFDIKFTCQAIACQGPSVTDPEPMSLCFVKTLRYGAYFSTLTWSP